MIVYRIAAEKYANKRVASGRPGRWNLADQFVIYTASSRSLATLELLVNRSGIRPNSTYKVMVIELPDSFDQIVLSDLPKDWRKFNYYAHLQLLAASWYEGQDTLALCDPSAVIPKESNFVIHTRHKDFQREIKLLDVEDYFWDDRLNK